MVWPIVHSLLINIWAGMYFSQEIDKIKQLTVGPLLAQCISNIHNRKSISALFK